MNATPKPTLRAAARTFAVTPKVGDPTSSRTGVPLSRVVGDLKITVLLLEDGPSRLCMVTAPLLTEKLEMRTEIERVAAGIGLKPDEVVGFGSHNHCAPQLMDDSIVEWSRLPGAPATAKLNPLGKEFIAGLTTAMQELSKSLVPVTVEWGVAQEDRFVYNRRGKRPDGRAYFIREEDRLLLGEDYKGLIDPDATLVVLRGADGRPVAGIIHYTGHPVTAFNPERMISFGEFPQVAGEIVSAEIGAPVAFLQGCAGDINAKHLLTGTVEHSTQFGRQLAETLIKASRSLKPSTRTDFAYRRVPIELPFAELPDLASLRRDLAEIDEFIARGKAGDPETLYCVGMNFPRVLTPPYRARLVEMIRPWFIWAIDMHERGRLAEIPKFLPLRILVARIGDVGLVGLPFEPFVRIGLRIKRESSLPWVMPCGYSGGANGYVPDAQSCDEREYTGGFFRYTRYRPPYRAPAGEAASVAAVEALKTL